MPNKLSIPALPPKWNEMGLSGTVPEISHLSTPRAANPFVLREIEGRTAPHINSRHRRTDFRHARAGGNLTLAPQSPLPPFVLRHSWDMNGTSLLHPPIYNVPKCLTLSQIKENGPRLPSNTLSVQGPGRTSGWTCTRRCAVLPVWCNIVRARRPG